MFGRRTSVSDVNRDAVNGNAASTSAVGQGYFWKKGSAFRSWKHRHYKIRENAILTYYDVKTDSSRGNFNIREIKISFGAMENVWELETEDGMTADAIAIDIFSYSDIRNLELVLLSRNDVRVLCRSLAKVCSQHNIMTFLDEFDNKFGPEEPAVDKIEDLASLNLSQSDNLITNPASSPVYVDVLTGVFLMHSYSRDTWKKRTFRIRKCTSHVSLYPGVLESSGGSVDTEISLRNIEVRIDMTISQGSVVMIVQDLSKPAGAPAELLSVPRIIEGKSGDNVRRVFEASIILYTNGMKLPTDSSDATKQEPISNSNSAKTGPIDLAPNVLMFLAALKDAAISSNVESLIKSYEGQHQSELQDMLTTAAIFFNRRKRAPVLLGLIWLIMFWRTMNYPTALLSLFFSVYSTCIGMFILEKWNRLPKAAGLFNLFV